MNRFHVHVAVTNLKDSIGFYNKLFGQLPTVEKTDYAKWMLENPGVNFAISARGLAAGINHLGIQVEGAEELSVLRAQAAAAAGESVLDQADAACCYAKSEKHWIIDPQGLAWEHFHTLAEGTVFGDDGQKTTGACCIPTRGSEQDSPKAACCIPNETEVSEETCCQ